jgi:hypothetical protein
MRDQDDGESHTFVIPAELVPETPIGERESRAQGDFYREFLEVNYPQYGVVTI